jgi:hypothetical protein
MSEFKYVTVSMKTASGSTTELLIEGFGPCTIVGAVEDLVSGVYNEEGKEVTEIKITKDLPK